MTQTEMEQVLESLDRRLSHVEQILPTLATKDDLKAFATKDDLKAFATKDDLKAFATKDDVKADLKVFATKDDFAILERKIDSVQDDVRVVAEAVANLAVRLEQRGVI